MQSPFEGLLGNNSSLRVLEFLISRTDMEFNITELANKVKISWPIAQKVIEKYVKWGVMKKAQERGGIAYYEINTDSPFVIWLEEFNTLLIEHILGDETLYQINDYWQQHATVSEKPQRAEEQKGKKVAFEDRMESLPYNERKIRPESQRDIISERTSTEVYGAYDFGGFNAAA